MSGGKADLKDTLASIATVADAAALGGGLGVAKLLGVDVRRGLSQSQVSAHQAAFGENRLPVKKPRR